MGTAVFAQIPDSIPPVADTQPQQTMPSAPAITDAIPDSPAVRPVQLVQPRTSVQTPPLASDSLSPAGTVISIPVDSISMRPLWYLTPWDLDSSYPASLQILYRHPFFNFAAEPIVVHSVFRKVKGKEVMFYTIVGFLLIFALLKQGFGKYFVDMLRVFFRTSMKQRQIREQLMQNPFPSLVFNIFFIASAGLYTNFLLQHFEVRPVNNFWLMYLYCCIGLIVIYMGKYISLKLIGWLLNIKKAADSYIFIVFIINKMIGVLLVPFIVLLAFTSEPMYTVSLILSWCCIGALLLYRFVLGYAAIRKEVKFNLFHFLLYLSAFEIAPLLLIYKLLLLVFK